MIRAAEKTTQRIRAIDRMPFELRPDVTHRNVCFPYQPLPARRLTATLYSESGVLTLCRNLQTGRGAMTPHFVGDRQRPNRVVRNWRYFDRYVSRPQIPRGYPTSGNPDTERRTQWKCGSTRRNTGDLPLWPHSRLARGCRHGHDGNGIRSATSTHHREMARGRDRCQHCQHVCANDGRHGRPLRHHDALASSHGYRRECDDARSRALGAGLTSNWCATSGRVPMWNTPSRIGSCARSSRPTTRTTTCSGITSKRPVASTFRPPGT